MNALTDVFADVFRARDGDATLAGLEILAAGFALILIAGVTYWLVRRKRRRDWAQWRERCEKRVTVNRQHLELLASDEERLDSIVQDIRARIIADWGPADAKPDLKLYKGGVA